MNKIKLMMPMMMVLALLVSPIVISDGESEAAGAVATVNGESYETLGANLSLHHLMDP